MSEVTAPLNRVGDLEGCKWDNGVVTTPTGFKEAYKQYCEAGWGALTAEEKYGGQGLPHVLGIAMAEIQSSANMAFAMYPGLTHGAFYSYFSTKDELASAAFGHAIGTGRPHWIKPSQGESWRARLTSLAKRYLTPAHRDDLATSCAFAAVGSEAARGSEEFRRSYERELRTSLAAICGDNTDAERFDDAIDRGTIREGRMRPPSQPPTNPKTSA